MMLTDEAIVRAAMYGDDKQDDDNTVESCRLQNSWKFRISGNFKYYFEAATDNEFDSHEVMFLRRLRDLAFEMKCENYKQNSITDLFKKN